MRECSVDPNIITQSILADTLQISIKTVEKHLKNLREQGLIRRVGPDKGGHWEIIKVTAGRELSHQADI